MIDFRLNGRTAVVTGSSSGIGRAIALAYLDAGANVIGVSRSNDGTEELVEHGLRAGGRFSHVTADLSARRDVLEHLVPALRAFGEVNILVHAAGLNRRAPAVDFSSEDWDAVLEVNLTAGFLLSRELGADMVERGSGSIVMIASLLSFQGGMRVPAYAASKGGVAQLVKALANEWASSGVNVNGIAPGYVRTPMNDALIADGDRFQAINDRIPAGRWADPDDIAGAAVFLASPAARYVHGTVLPVDGGWLGR
jgi:2-deoxy-D-gluconate 3-dehydrogenase